MPTAKEIKEESNNIVLTPEILKDMISAAVSTAIQESKKTHYTEKELADIEQAQQMRIDQAASVLAEIDAIKNYQRTCSHKHARTGDTHCVYILDGNYILCQKCIGIIRPGDPPVGYKGKHIYNTELFNRLFQECGTNELFG
jgi:hypothetical protein